MFPSYGKKKKQDFVFQVSDIKHGWLGSFLSAFRDFAMLQQFSSASSFNSFQYQKKTQYNVYVSPYHLSPVILVLSVLKCLNIILNNSWLLAS